IRNIIPFIAPFPSSVNHKNCHLQQRNVRLTNRSVMLLVVWGYLCSSLNGLVSIHDGDQGLQLFPSKCASKNSSLYVAHPFFFWRLPPLRRFSCQNSQAATILQTVLPILSPVLQWSPSDNNKNAGLLRHYNIIYLL
uniref:Uncharacterized protein n=1 Tax=Erpetoichthys calabaricus TaxID=27687 RepID=A0A8C4RID8_ERPCA